MSLYFLLYAMTPISMHQIIAPSFKNLRNTRFKLCQHKVGEFTVVIIDVTFGSQDLILIMYDDNIK